MNNESEATRPNKEIAEFWNVTDRTVKTWRAKGAPVEDDDGMAKWLRAHPACITDGVRKRLRDFTSLSSVDPDWEEFQKAAIEQTDDDPKKAMAMIAKARSFAAFKFEKASAVNDQDGIKFYADLLAKLEGTLHDAQLRAKKLGIDQGELVPRSEVERILRAWAFWSMRSVDADLADLCPKLTGLAQVNDARAVLEPALLSARFLKPFVRASRISSPAAVPGWMVAIVQDAVDDYIEDGAREFEAATNA
jgi:hypothetical protein